jgi:predicted permease
VSIPRAAEMLTPLNVQIDLERNGPFLSEADRKELAAEKLALSPAAQGLSGLRERFTRPLRAVFAMVALGLLLACINVMSLQFARADERRRELTVRLAIGASRFRIARQLLAESLLIGVASGALGLALCRPVANGLSNILTLGGDQNLHLVLPLNASLLVFVLVVSLAAALLSGVAPAMRATRGDVAPGLQQGTRGTTVSPVRRTVGRSVAIVQLALSLVLIAGTCLFAYNLHLLRETDTGIRRSGLLVLDIDPGIAGYKDAAAVALNLRLRERLQAVPGVEAVSFSQSGLYSWRNFDTNFDADGFPKGAPGRHHSIYDHVGPGFFRAAGAHILAGRDFEDRDRAGSPNVAIVTQSFARRVFKNRNPIGLNLYLRSGEKDTYQIIGVVNDLRGDVRYPVSMFYLCQLQSEVQAMTTRLLIRSRSDASTFMSALRPAVRDVDPELRVNNIISAEELFDRTVDRDRLLATLSWGFGILALTLAAVGIYGLLSFEVTRRTGEIGIRMAVGARKGNIVALVLREVAIVCGAGLAAGVLAAAELTRLAEGMVFGFKAGDPRVLAAAALILVAMALLAALIPARRAAAMDPMRALRCE